MRRDPRQGPHTVLNTNVNLLVALDALLRERSVTGAARLAGITQSSMSGVLAQLREVLDDPILVRAGRGMQPTPYATRLIPSLRRSMELLDDVLSGGPGFEPRTSRERFVLALSDRIESVIFSELTERVHRTGPHLTMQVVPWGRLEPPPMLVTGEIDVMVGIVPPKELQSMSSARLELPPGHRFEPLYDSGLVSIVRKDHPRVGHRLTLKAFCELDHVLVTEQPNGRGIVDELLARDGRSRNIAVRVPRHTLVPELIARTDLVATIDRRVALAQAERLGLRVCKTPVPLAMGSVAMIWHERTQADEARAWLREQIAAVARRHR